MTERILYKRRFLFWGLLIGAAAILIPVAMNVETADALGGGPDGFGYSWTDDVTYNYTQGASATGLANDDQTVVPIGFDFEFYGQVYSDITVCSDGALHFDGNVPVDNESVSLAVTATRGIFPMWDNLNPGAGGDVFVSTVGTSPNRVFLAEWRNVPHWFNNAPYYYIGDGSFVVKLFEEDNSIEFHYADVNYGDPMYDFGANASIGIADPSQGHYLLVSYNAASLAANYALRFDPPATCVDGDGDGWTDCDGDCDDANVDIHPGAAETCDDGIDSNCDGQTDELADADGDGFTTCDGDCDDFEIDAFPGNVEVCDWIDNDCDGWIDNGFDLDADGWTTCEGDCDDANVAVHPSEAEVCDLVDNNCDGNVDEGLDADGDGWTVCGGDCDDTDPDISPGAIELCDGLDSDCDGAPESYEFDDDGDGYLECEECNDEDASIYPGAPETCDDGIDSDCLNDLEETEEDNDNDTYSECGGDCDDEDPDTNPGAEEICNQQHDDDCNPATDEIADSDMDSFTICTGDCDDFDAGVNPDQEEICDTKDNDCNGLVDDGIDYDHDGFSGCDAEDCDDYNAGTYPGATEVPYDNIDQDCDGEDLKDIDGDGHDGGAYGEDCDDTDPAINPDAAENCENGIDDNCNGIADQYDDACTGSGDDDDAGDDDDGSVDCSCDASSRVGPTGAILIAALAALVVVRRR